MASSKPVKSSPKASKQAPARKPVAKVAPRKAAAPKTVAKVTPKAPAKAAPARVEAPAVKGKAAPTNGEKKKSADPRTSTSVNAPLIDNLANSGKQTPFLMKQRDRLLALRDNILDSMNGVAKDTLRSRAEGSEASAFGMHQADAGSDAYDRDFALSLLSQEQDALYEIEEALKRVETGDYGMCEMSGKPIAHARLEAIPFARYTVECQAQIEKTNKIQRSRTPVTSLFGLTDGEEAAESEEEEAPATEKE
jgi:RNA polymerase-binding transcription factor DksA